MKKEYFTDPKGVLEYNEAQSPLWFWNDKLEKEELEKQLSLMTEKGITCNAPHARTGFEGGYLDRDWMEHMKTVIDYKAEHGETMWLYDEFNWPSGIANGEVTKNEELRESYLSLQRFFVPANTRFRIQPTMLKEMELDVKEYITNDFQGKKNIDNLFVYDAETMERLDIRQYQPDDHSGQLFNLSENDFEILRDRDTVVFEAKVHTELFRKEGFYDPDYLNADATEKFIETTYEAYYRQFADAFGTVITAGFDDESRFCHAFPWTGGLLEEFEKKYGYRLEERLPDLILPGAEAGRTRCHYFNLIADMYRGNYHKKLRSWCEAHGIDYCPHLLGEESVAGQVRYNGEMMRQFREMTRPGVDHLGKGIGSLNIRFVSSAAEVYGKKGLACEAFAANGWDLTYEEYIRTISWLYSQGVNTITNHAFFYSIRDARRDDWPPSQFFQWKGWDRMEQANAMCRRIYGMVKDSSRKTDLLIYHPVESFWLHYIPDQNFTHGFHMGPLIQGERAAHIDRQEQILLNELQEHNRDFTVFPSDATDQFTARNGKLINKNTNQQYSAFVLPMCQVLPLESARLLEQFALQGGHIAIMETIPEYGMKKEEDQELKAVISRILNAPNTRFYDDTDTGKLLAWLSEVSPQSIQIIEGANQLKKNLLHYPDWVIDPYIHTGEDMTGISWTEFKGDKTKYYFVNYTDTPQDITVQLNSTTPPELWDTLTGQIQPAHILESTEIPEETGAAGAIEEVEGGEGVEAEAIETKESMTATTVADVKKAVTEGQKTDKKQKQYKIQINLPKDYGVFLVTSAC